MKASRIISAAALAALVILGAGCKKSQWRPVAGELIQFRAVSAPEKALDSKTVYSGEFFRVGEGENAPRFERIDWVEGDMITIAYLSHTQGTNFKIASDDYKITGVSDNGDQASYATIAPTGGPYGTEGEGWGGNGLTWQDNETHMFYACYPGVAKDSDYTFKMEGGEIVATVPFDYPAVQVVTPSATNANVYLPDMTYAAMLYSQAGDGISLPSGGDKVINLSFSPHFTAFEFQVAAKEGDSFTLKSFTLSSASENIAGRFLWTLGDDGEDDGDDDDDDDDDDWYDAPVEGTVSKTVSVDFSSFNITLTDSQPITFTVFTRGEEDWKDLTITFVIENGEGTTINRSLKLADAGKNYLRFRHHLKHRIYGLQIPLGLELGTLWFETDGAGSYQPGNDPFDGEI